MACSDGYMTGEASGVGQTAFDAGELMKSLFRYQFSKATMTDSPEYKHTFGHRSFVLGTPGYMHHSFRSLLGDSVPGSLLEHVLHSWSADRKADWLASGMPELYPTAEAVELKALVTGPNPGDIKDFPAWGSLEEKAAEGAWWDTLVLIRDDKSKDAADDARRAMDNAYRDIISEIDIYIAAETKVREVFEHQDDVYLKIRIALAKAEKRALRKAEAAERKGRKGRRIAKAKEAIRDGGRLLTEYAQAMFEYVYVSNPWENLDDTEYDFIDTFRNTNSGTVWQETYPLKEFRTTMRAENNCIEESLAGSLARIDKGYSLQEAWGLTDAQMNTPTAELAEFGSSAILFAHSLSLGRMGMSEKQGRKYFVGKKRRPQGTSGFEAEPDSSGDSESDSGLDSSEDYDSGCDW
jgi:hypothetical protein